jgi:membrane-bound lytic murein transglycosylase B
MVGAWAKGVALAVLQLAVLACAGLIACAGPARAANTQGFTAEELEPLLGSLQAEGFSRPDLNRIFHDKRLQKIDRVVTFNVFNPDSSGIYAQFRSAFAIKLAKGFRKRYLEELKQIEAKFGVMKEVIVAILLVETQFGTAALRYRPLEVFTTLIVDAAPGAVDRHFDRLKPAYPKLEREFLEARLHKKAQWAYAELVALLTMHDLQRVDDLYSIRGSYAGAFGMPQFLPSSYLSWAVDGNKDRRIDLDNPSDAIASIANFLKVHGWKRHGPQEDNLRAVWEYNHSQHYVNTIMAVARLTVPRKPSPPVAQPAPAVEPAPGGEAERVEPVTLLPWAPAPGAALPGAPGMAVAANAPARQASRAVAR